MRAFLARIRHYFRRKNLDDLYDQWRKLHFHILANLKLISNALYDRWRKLRFRILASLKLRSNAPFMLCMAPPSQLNLRQPGSFISNAKLDASQPNTHSDSDYALYLWPDRIRTHYLAQGLLFGLGFLCLSDSFLIGIGAFFWSVPVAPWIIYVIFRSPVLGKYWETWPDEVDPLYQVAIQKDFCKPGNGLQNQFRSWLMRHLAMLRALIPSFSARSDPSVWRPSGSTQEAYLRKGVNDFFHSNRATDLWCDIGFIRWLIWWCAPIVTGQIFLLLAFALVLIGPSDTELKLDGVGLLVICWTLYATYFLWIQTCKFPFYAEFRTEDVHRLPFLAKKLKPGHLGESLPSIRVKLVLATIGLNLIPSLTFFLLRYKF
ncbi:MAG: hypothetical protein JMN24_04845 [gamma proteobacterium endosymbiont of Lamellibrachia anaximandri]|nr:hypothetical protein [gamma proteobacterium endosymbiont of Lamellibrachia anaximandri]